MFDNIPICHFAEDAKVADTTATGGRSTMQDDQIARSIALTWQGLGPLPEEALRAFVDLGLDDHEIGRYHAVPPAAVSTLRKHYRIATANDEASKADRMIGKMENDVNLAGILRAKGDSSSLSRPRSGGKLDTEKSVLRQFALSVRLKLFGGQ